MKETDYSNKRDGGVEYAARRQEERESHRHEEYLLAINTLVDKIRTDSEAEERHEQVRGRREGAIIKLALATTIFTGLAAIFTVVSAVIFYNTMVYGKAAADQSSDDNGFSLEAANRNASYALENAHGDALAGLRSVHRDSVSALEKAHTDSVAALDSAATKSDAALNATLAANEVSRTALSLDHRPRIATDNLSVGPVDITGEGITVTVTTNLTNHGTVSALEVRSYIQIFEKQDDVSLFNSQQLTCNSADSQNPIFTIGIDGAFPLSQTINQPKSMMQRFLPPGISFIEGDIDKDGFFGKDYILSGCVSYKSPVDKTVRYSRFMFALGERVNGTPHARLGAIPHIVAPANVVLTGDPATARNDD